MTIIRPRRWRQPWLMLFLLVVWAGCPLCQRRAAQFELTVTLPLAAHNQLSLATDLSVSVEVDGIQKKQTYPRTVLQNALIDSILSFTVTLGEKVREETWTEVEVTIGQEAQPLFRRRQRYRLEPNACNFYSMTLAEETRGDGEPSDGAVPDSLGHLPEGEWQNAPSLPGRVDYIPGFTAGKCLYVLSEKSTSVHRACQQELGSLSDWTTTDSGYSIDRVIPVAVVARSQRSHVLLGPLSGVLQVGSVEHKSQELKGWQASGGIRDPQNLVRTITMSASTTVSVGGATYFFSMAGYEEGAVTPTINEVFRAQVLEGGSLGAWQYDVALNTDDRPMSPTAVVATLNGKPFIYLLGGSDCCAGLAPLKKIRRAAVGDHGAIKSSWVNAGELPYAAASPLAFVRQGYLWILGGYEHPSVHEDVWRTKINPDGSLGTWEQRKALPGPAEGTPSGFIGDYFYVVGQSNWTTTPVYYAYFAP